MNIKHLLALTAALLAGCASRTLPSQYTLNANGDKGIVVASITHNGTFGNHTVRLQNRDGSVTERFSVGFVSAIPIPQKYDIKDEEKKGDVFSVELPQGNYKIDSWSVDSYGFHVGSPTSIRFTVEPGKVTYLGRFEFDQTTTQGVQVLAAAVSVKDESEADMSIVAGRTPALSGVPVAINVATTKAAQELNTVRPNRESVMPFVFVPPTK